VIFSGDDGSNNDYQRGAKISKGKVKKNQLYKNILGAED
jgi:hypothetical protein